MSIQSAINQSILAGAGVVALKKREQAQANAAQEREEQAKATAQKKQEDKALAARQKEEAARQAIEQEALTAKTFVQQARKEALKNPEGKNQFYIDAQERYSSALKKRADIDPTRSNINKYLKAQTALERSKEGNENAKLAAQLKQQQHEEFMKRFVIPNKWGNL